MRSHPGIAGILLLLCGKCAAVPPVLADKVVLDDPMAMCLDGSRAVMYVSAGTRAGAFYIYHEGGGWCQTADECALRAQGVHGSSASYEEQLDLSGVQTRVFFSRNVSLNPLMNDWTFVYLPYCDGGSFTGDARVDAPIALEFRGRRIRAAAVAQLPGFRDGGARDVVVGGCSAGGAAAFLHADWYVGLDALLLPPAQCKNV